MTGLRFTILSCSLDAGSRSRLLAREAYERLVTDGHAVTFIDLRDFALPAFDNHEIYGHPHFPRLHQVIREAEGVILAVPVYNWGVGSAAKNLVEATGSTDGERGLSSAWFDQFVTFLVSGGLSAQLSARLDKTLRVKVELAGRLRGRPYRSDWEI